ncbi:hypothetical protein [Streptomyces lavendulae]|uniref:hypothetical protein n=1 Tax=Streptomyces lavendulae TaxID=1914 RepID=UPI0024A2358F|nr:hypothetical protein [Streptomyces lavendulae]GLX20369.1 hypothetical protein Slala01_40130 [Streptomyces lavendulae subsp. lavendulae]GLX26932.1 hypothetical protein Slala02_27520 [Streptomyces lavendulae subsp. lavendulae]
METARRRTIVRATAVTACAGALLALPTAAALADGAPAATGAQRTLVSSISLADGRSTAKVYRLAKDAYQAEILRAGTKVATLTSRDGSTGVGAAGELHAALRPDGRLSSWVGDTVPGGGSHAVAGDGHKTGTRHGAGVAAGQVVPASLDTPAGGAAGSPSGSTGKGGSGAPGTAEALRLNTLADGPGDGVLLLAAGGGIAAIGAAGLGFAMLRRGRTDG